jgi:hypothetical protein
MRALTARTLALPATGLFNTLAAGFHGFRPSMSVDGILRKRRRRDMIDNTGWNLAQQSTHGS